MLLTVLGTATPYPRPGNACSGYLLQSGAGGAHGAGAAGGEAGATGAGAAPAQPERLTTIWIDAGTGTLAELQRHTTLPELDAIWISHRHADHSADLLVAYYALRFAELRPAHPIPLFGPEGLLERLGAFLGPNSVDELPRVFDFRPLSGFGEARVGPLALSWGPVQHGVPAFGLTVDEGLRRFAYSGDSAPCLSLEEIAENADLLLVEAGYATSEAAGTDAPAHHTPEDTGRTATTSGARHLVLTHIADTVSPAEARARASACYDGPITVAEPGARIPI
ncbi:MAG: MBL fold metallo-hydrolase [Herbiconiux sp.]|uniref:MBL fold metallo-hydrolase n=1 Tax=Herbiconiux sp. TaxID=1871186 RepID=UPI00120EFB61|nr:MBL fold metallo-hydrolase [Herbiconiux sp.]TAJ48310.1 MAG: MBL fold metallo-hydrolase [Herbiconiux sp.]